MIGKKSKFEEHGKNSLQNQEDKDQEKKNRSRNTEYESTDSQNILQIGDNFFSGEKIEHNDDIRFISESQFDLQELSPQEEEGYQNLQESIEPIGENDRNSESSSTRISNFTRHGENFKTVTIINPKNLKTDTDLLWDEICNGVQGKNSGIPMGFNRLNRYLGLRRSIYTTIGAAAGCGKTSLVDCAYVLNPYDWYIKNKDKPDTKVKFEVLYFSMERKKTYKLAKWLCMKIWMEEGILITTDELLSWQNKLDSRKQEMAKFYIEEYFKEMTESGIVTIIDGQMNPTGIFKFMKDHALKQGKEVQVNQWESRYIPNNDNLITNVIHDHAGKTKNENIGGKYDKKLSIDKASEYYCWARDYLGYSPIMINQFNRTSYQDIQFSKKEGGDPDPTVEYWKDSGNVIEDCDVAISLFNPYKYSLEEYMGYQVNDFTDAMGNNKFRGLKIIKNSYGTDNIRIGLGFLGEVSLFKEITRSDQLSPREVASIINNQFFS